MANQQGDIKIKRDIHLKDPDMYRVRMHNDDFTTMEFVVFILINIFFKSEEEANTLMLTIHTKGSAIVGTYTLDLAMSKAEKARNLASQEGFPLKITVEQE